MRTDIPLKRLAALCGADILTLVGMPPAVVRRVDALELPSSAERLDTVLTVESAGGTEYLLVIEWQGYRDPGVLWRLASYCAWVGQRNLDRPVVGALVYVTPAADVGDTLAQVIDGTILQTWAPRVVRLWELDAPASVMSGLIGMAVLSPLMRNANAQVVEQAIEQVLSHAEPAQQADLLAILGVFAEPFITAERFVQRVGKERLMASDLVSYLLEEQTTRYIEELQETLEGAIAARFPDAPLSLALTIRQVTQPEQLHRLILAVVRASDLTAVTAELTAAAAAPPPA
jgi:hypothetical protein